MQIATDDSALFPGENSNAAEEEEAAAVGDRGDYDDPPCSVATTEYYPLPFHQRKLVKFIFLLLGIGFLLPWNAFVSASAYFETRTLTTDENKSNKKKKNNFMLWFSLLYNLSGVLSLALMLIWQKWRHVVLPNWNIVRMATSVSRRDLEWRFVVVSLSLFLLVMILTAWMVLIPSLDAGFFQTISLVSAAICGTSGAFTSAGIVSFAQIFPPNLGIQPFISGQAVGGVVISILNFVLFGVEVTGLDTFWAQHCDTTKQGEKISIGTFILSSSTSSSSFSSSDYQIDWGAFAYFTVGCIIISSCIGLFVYLDRAPITQYYRCNNDTRGGDNDDGNVDVQVTQSLSTRAGHAIRQREDDEMNVLAEPLLNGEAVDVSSTDTWAFLKISASTVFSTFLITITIFPSWITRLESVHECEDKHNRISNDLFIPGLIVLFNIFDLLGRVTAGRFANKYSTQLLKDGSRLRWVAWMRISFLPVFLLFKTSSSSHNHHQYPLVVFNDWIPALSTAFLAYTNGCISTLAFTFAALSVPSDDDMQQVSSTILNFAVGLGLLSGSLLSFVYSFVGSSVV
mmetsp:Transcript_1392/g.2531  ORF Transcript_1392/g.2531 Transcript_1392/m.2531 type:complete len:569 (-) Transcript_1392:73-1779(-)